MPVAQWWRNSTIMPDATHCFMCAIRGKASSWHDAPHMAGRVPTHDLLQTLFHLADTFFITHIWTATSHQAKKSYNIIVFDSRLPLP